MQKQIDKRIEFKIENLSDKDLLISGYDLINGTCNKDLKVEKVRLDSDILEFGVSLIRLSLNNDYAWVIMEDVVKRIYFINTNWCIEDFYPTYNLEYSVIDLPLFTDELHFRDLRLILKSKSLVTISVFTNYYQEKK